MWVVAIALCLPVLPAVADAAPRQSPADPCVLVAGSPNGPIGTEYLSTGTIPVANIYLDFSDGEGASSPTSITDMAARFAGYTPSWLDQASYGRAAMPITQFTSGWVRMPKPSTAYSGAQMYPTFLADAEQAVAAAGIDVSGFEKVNLFTPTDVLILSSTPTVAHGGAYGGERWNTVPGNDILGLAIYADGSSGFSGYRSYGERFYLHEMVHLLAIPDLYAYDNAGGQDGSRFVGQYDLMGAAAGHSPDLFAFNKWRLGWIDDAEVECVTDAGTTTVTLAALHTATGTRMINLPIDAAGRSVALEYRATRGLDVDGCVEGILAYSIDQTLASGAGPLRVIDATPGSIPTVDGSRPRCEHRDIEDAPLTPSMGPVDLGNGFTARVVSMNGTTASVEVERQTTLPTPSSASSTCTDDPAAAGLLTSGTPEPFDLAVANGPGKPELYCTAAVASGDDITVTLTTAAGNPGESSDVMLAIHDAQVPTSSSELSSGRYSSPVTVTATTSTVLVAISAVTPGEVPNGTVELSTTTPPSTTAGIVDGDPATTDRVGADGPIANAIAVSAARFGDDAAAHVVLARDDAFPDSLAGTPLLAEGPLLLVPTNALVPTVRAELDRVLAPGGRVYLLGGEAAIGAAVQDELVVEGYNPVRLAGPGRVETSVAIAEEVQRLYPGSGGPVIARAYGVAGNESAGWADSVNVGGFAASARRPVVLTGSDSLHPAVATYLSTAGHSTASLVGGTAALSDTVAQQLVVSGVQPTRVAGASRDETAATIATNLWGNTTNARTFVIIDGYSPLGWAYGLPAAGLSADLSAPTLPVAPGAPVPPATASAVTTCGTKSVESFIAGPVSVIDSALAGQVEALDGSC